MYRFLLIDEDEEVTESLLPYIDKEQASIYGQAVAKRLVNSDQISSRIDLETMRDPLRSIALKQPRRIEVVVVDAATREAVLPPTMIRRAI